MKYFPYFPPDPGDQPGGQQGFLGETELKEKMVVDLKKLEVVTKLLTILQIDGKPRGRINEAFSLCLQTERQRER